MVRTVAIALVVMASFDYFFLDGKYLRALESGLLSMIHFVVR
jgi:hypothetical protein